MYLVIRGWISYTSSVERIVGWTTHKTLPFCFSTISITSCLRRKDTRLSVRYIFAFWESLGTRLAVYISYNYCWWYSMTRMYSCLWWTWLVGWYNVWRLFSFSSSLSSQSGSAKRHFTWEAMSQVLNASLVDEGRCDLFFTYPGQMSCPSWWGNGRVWLSSPLPPLSIRWCHKCVCVCVRVCVCVCMCVCVCVHVCTCVCDVINCTIKCYGMYIWGKVPQSNYVIIKSLELYHNTTTTISRPCESLFTW